jgi:hypothetical protein
VTRRTSPKTKVKVDPDRFELSTVERAQEMIDGVIDLVTADARLAAASGIRWRVEVL